MGLGVLEDRHLDHVPGTALLTDVVGAEQQGGLNTSLLKHAKGRDSDVMLVPQPSRSPSDPLNWSLWKKDLMLFFICIDTAIVGAWSYNELNGGLGWGIFVIGISCFITNSLTVIYGRRPILARKPIVVHQ
ncbi:hypothetical protein LTR37_013509 [Vermiconidia calcicola]|uniref:Uncharacterized protein n=1 Tax=Vermiconidia calcicola TaxID=1690605 RepID=A0ACC3MWA5_9PEZI|nr:hypothetical protein LTR37_013509 [Vermiconidia calcicola]